MKQSCGLCGQSAAEETILARYARKKNQVKERINQSELLTRNSSQ